MTSDANASTKARAGRHRWAEALAAAVQTEQPLQATIFTVEQLEMHARALAGAHAVVPGHGRERLLARLADNERAISEVYDLVSDAEAAGRRIAPAAEWLLDNYYLIEEQIRLARRHFPRGYARMLPRLKSGEMAGFPRIYDVILRLISHLAGQVDDETLGRFMAAYQSVNHLTLGELWAVPIMLRLGLIENLRRVAANVSWRRIHRDVAQSWAKRLNEAAAKRDAEAVLVLADMMRNEPPLSTAFVAEFTQAIQGRGSAVSFVLGWLDQSLADRGQTIEEMLRAEGHGQAADQVSMSNTIAGLRFIGARDWHEFVEANSFTERVLRADPSGTYALMDQATRDSYRHAVEDLARQCKVSEEQV